jgi:chromosome segregation ATPase
LKIQLEKKQERVHQLSLQTQQLERENRDLQEKFEITENFKLKLQDEVKTLRESLQNANAQIRDFKSQYKDKYK